LQLQAVCVLQRRGGPADLCEVLKRQSLANGVSQVNLRYHQHEVTNETILEMKHECIAPGTSGVGRGVLQEMPLVPRRSKLQAKQWQTRYGHIVHKTGLFLQYTAGLLLVVGMLLLKNELKMQQCQTGECCKIGSWRA
jgi:hypothetical protein